MSIIFQLKKRTCPSQGQLKGPFLPYPPPPNSLAGHPDGTWDPTQVIRSVRVSPNNVTEETCRLRQSVRKRWTLQSWGVKAWVSWFPGKPESPGAEVMGEQEQCADTQRGQRGVAEKKMGTVPVKSSCTSWTLIPSNSINSFDKTPFHLGKNKKPKNYTTEARSKKYTTAITNVQRWYFEDGCIHTRPSLIFSAPFHFISCGLLVYMLDLQCC